MSRDDFSVRRRSLLAGSAAAFGGSALVGTPRRSRAAQDGIDTTSADGTIPPVEFFFPTPLLNANREPLRDDDLIAVEAEPTAELKDAKAHWTIGQYGAKFEEDGYLVDAPDGAPLPLVAVDDRNVAGTIAGLGSLLVPDGATWRRGNDEFLLNLWDSLSGRAGETTKTVLFHEFTGDSTPADTHNDQYWTLERFSEFFAYARSNGYEIVSDYREYGQDAPAGRRDDNAAFVAALQTENPDLVMLHCPNRFDDTALEALGRYVEDGGAVVLHDSSDPAVEEWRRPDGDDRRETSQSDPSEHLNEIAAFLGIGFRFNDALVVDETNNVGTGVGFEQIPITGRFATDEFPELFDARPGRAETETFYHYVGNITYINDGDTIEVSVSGESEDVWELRILGLDTPEPDAVFVERPPEWEGVADTPDQVAAIQELQFEDACSLRGPAGRLQDDAVAARAAHSATNRNETGDGSGYVDYGDAQPPLVAVEDAIAGIGSVLVDDDSPNPTSRESTPQFDLVLNVWDALTGGGATVLYDEGHGQTQSLEDFSAFTGSSSTHDFPEHYSVEATTDIALDLADADAVWLTPPAEPFTEAELAALEEFVDAGGRVFLHGRADATGEAYTANLNEVAAAVGAGFRFNDDTVVDPVRNGGSETQPVTDAFDDTSRFRYFTLRQTDASFAASTPNEAYESTYLTTYADQATEYAGDKFVGGRVVIEFDPNAAINDGLGRLLTYVWRQDQYPKGKSYNRQIIEDGFARVYDSSYTKHDEFLQAELEARADGRGVWTESTPEQTQMVRNHPVRNLHVPHAAAVGTTGGDLPADRAPVRAESTADPGAVPLVGVDESARVGVIGGPLLAENMELREDDTRTIFFINDDPLNMNTADFGNFPFTTNLATYLAAEDRDGGVVFESGHGQFGGSVDRFGTNYTLSYEDARYYERFLEGVDIKSEAINDLPANLAGDTIVRGQTLIISTPPVPYTEDDLAAVEQFRDNGGSVLLIGSSEAPADERANLNAIAETLGSDLRITDTAVTDETNNLRNLPAVPTTTNFERSFDLFDPVETGGAGPGLDRAVTEATFSSTASLRAPGNEPLTGRDTVAVWAEPTARTSQAADTTAEGLASAYTSNADERREGDAARPYNYSDRLVPLAAVDGPVVGFGAILAANGTVTATRLLLNAWDATVDGETILWDESHDQFYDTGACSGFINVAGNAGYDVRPTTDLLEDLEDADAVVVTSPSQAFSQTELDALATFVDAGGAVFLHDQSDFADNDETGNLNAIAETLELSFRFQSDQVLDDENNDGADYKPVTTQLNREFPFFGGTEPAVEPTLSAAGFRDGDADAYTAGQTARIDVVVQDVTRPARLVDRLPEAWTVESDNASRIDGGRVDLGTVEPRGGPIVRTYFAEAPPTTGRYEFGPARVEGAADGASATAQVGGTDTNTVAGADQNDPASGPETGTGDDGAAGDGAVGDGGSVGDPVETPDIDDATDAGA